jgi:hypothetical protein
MNIISRTLEIDAGTDARLTEMAARRGVDVAAVLAEAVALLDSVVEPASPDIAEDRRRLDEFLRSREAVPLADAKAWGRELGFGGKTAPSVAAQDRMISFSPDAIADVERLVATRPFFCKRDSVSGVAPCAVSYWS